eukprot:626724-Pleurochrysis_carterae.AAC.1
MLSLSALSLRSLFFARAVSVSLALSFHRPLLRSLPLTLSFLHFLSCSWPSIVDLSDLTLFMFAARSICGSVRFLTQAFDASFCVLHARLKFKAKALAPSFKTFDFRRSNVHENCLVSPLRRAKTVQAVLEGSRRASWRQERVNLQYQICISYPAPRS